MRRAVSESSGVAVPNGKKFNFHPSCPDRDRERSTVQEAWTGHESCRAPYDAAGRLEQRRR